MKVGKLLFIWVFFMMAVIANPAALLFAAEPPGENTPEDVIGPTMWAVGVCDGSVNTVTLRVKKIEGCVVDTDPQSANLSCPVQASDLQYYRLGNGSVFGRCPAYQPIITKVKNFKVDGDIVSFDAQIQFVVPEGTADDVCQ